MVGEKRGRGRNRYLPFSGVPKSRGRSKPSSPPSSGLDQSRPSLDRARQRLKQKQRGLDEQRRCLEKQLRSLDERRRIIDEKLWRLEEEQLGLDENRPSTSTNRVAPPTIVLDSPSSPRPRPLPPILRRRPMANRLALARESRSTGVDFGSQTDRDVELWREEKAHAVIEQALRVRRRQQRIKRTQTPFAWREKAMVSRPGDDDVEVELVDEASGDCDHEVENSDVDEQFTDENAILSPAIDPKHRWGVGNRTCAKVESLVRCVFNNLKINCNDHAAAQTAKLTDLHVSTVRRIVSRTPELSPAILPDCRVVTKRKKSDIWAAAAAKIDGIVRDRIRAMVHACYRRTERVTVEKLHSQLKESFSNEDEQLKKQLAVSQSQFRNVLRGLQYRFGKIQGRAFVFDRPHIVAWLNRYLRTMIELRSREDVLPFFCDETWAFEQMSASRTWLDPLSAQDPEKARQLGYTTGPSRPPNKGKRVIILHAMSKYGLLKGAERVWISHTRTGDGDYHRYMNAELFEEWLRAASKLMHEEALKRGYKRAVLVMDNAPYHTRYETKVPPQNATKPVMVKFLTGLGIAANADEELARELRAKIDKLDHSRINKLAAEAIAKEHEVQIVRLPPYCCEYNPIELLWSWIKHKLEDAVAPEDKVAQIKEICLQLFQDVPEAICRRYCDYCQRLEQEAAEKAGLLHPAATVHNLGQFVINLDEEDEEIVEEDVEDGDDEVEEEEEWDEEF